MPFKLAQCLLCASVIFIGLPTAKAQEGSFSVGVSYDLTGSFASFGRQAEEGFDLAIKTWKEVKGDNVHGLKLRVVHKDAQSSTQVAVSSIIELINNEKINLLVGPDASDIASAVVPSWKQAANRPIWLLPGVSSTKAEALIGDDPYFFHGYGWAYAYGESLVGVLRTLPKKDGLRVAMLYTDGAYGRAQRDDAKEALSKAGIELVDEELMREGSPDIGSLVSKLRRAKPDVIYAPAQTGDAAQIAKQFYISKIGVPYLIGSASIPLAEWQKATGPAQSCWMGMSSWLPGLNYPADTKEPKLFPSSTEFEAKFRKEYGHDAEYTGVSHYSLTLIALLAADKTGTDRDKIEQAIASSEYMTPFGYAKFTPTRIAKHNAFFDQLVFQRQPAENGEYRSVVLYPQKIAQGKPMSCN